MSSLRARKFLIRPSASNKAQLDSPLDHCNLSLNSWSEIVFGRCLRGDRSFAMVEREINRFRNHRKLLKINFAGDPTLIGSPAFDGPAGVDRHMVVGRCQELAPQSGEFLPDLVKVNSLGVVILVKTHGQPEFSTAQHLFLGINPRNSVQMIAAI